MLVNENRIEIEFSRPIDPLAFTNDDVTVIGSGAMLSVTVDPVPNSDTRFGLTVEGLNDSGAYSLEVGPDVRDVNGDPMDQDEDGTANQPTDRFEGSFVYSDAEQVFTSDTLIGEDVQFDSMGILVDGATVTVDGQHTFRSVHFWPEGPQQISPGQSGTTLVVERRPG